jgi:hypothetical protein
VEWVLIVVTGVVAVRLLSDSGDLAPVLAFRRWWTNRRRAISRTAGSGTASKSTTNHPIRRFWLLYAFGVAAIIVLVTAFFIFPFRQGNPRLPDIGEPAQSQLNQQPEPVTTGPVVNQEHAFPHPREAFADGDIRTPPSSPRPKSYNSLPTGTRIEEDVGNDSHGKLTVENGTADDATVRLVNCETEHGVRWFFVKAHEGATVGGIEPGQYELRFTTGLDWDVDDEVFRWGAAYSAFDRKLTYVETHDAEGIDYHKMSVTLHAVPHGNAKTSAISRERFLRGHVRTRTP